MALDRLVRRRSRGTVGRPLLWFAGASLLAMVALGFSATAILRRQARGEAIRDAKEITRLAGEGIAEPALSTRSRAQFDDVIRSRVLEDPVVRVKIWDLDGRIVYSDEPALIGKRFALEPGVLSAVRQRMVAADVSDLSRPENRDERHFGKLLEVYLPIEGPHGRPLVFEDYIRFEAISASQERLLTRFAPALGVALLLLWLVQLPLAWSLTRRLRQRQAEREMLMRRALDASARERRQVAQHLHDGVAQDLAGVSFSLAAEGHHEAAATTRRALRELRSLVIGVYPPSLQRSGLPAAVTDLLAPLSTRGVAVTADVPTDLALAPETEELIFRGAQEALRNAAKHADPSCVEVSVSRVDGSVVLTVRDDGRGFDPTATDGSDDSSLGLHLLEDLVEERHGRLRVESTVGEGTILTMELDAR